MPLRITTDKPLYNPGEIATATTNAEPPYTITATVRGEIVGTSMNDPLSLAVLMAWSPGIIVFVVTQGVDSAQTHAHVS